MASCRMLSLRCPAATERSTKFFEIVTWAQLNIHSKPCVLINTDGYYDFLLRFLDHAVREEFVRAANLMLVQQQRTARQLRAGARIVTPSILASIRVMS